jgi:hypothetical protein
MAETRRLAPCIPDRRNFMLKNVFLAAAATLILAGGITAAAPVPADAKPRCDARADAMYPYNKNARKAYKKGCKSDHRAWKKRNDKGIWIVL